MICVTHIEKIVVVTNIISRVSISTQLTLSYEFSSMVIMWVCKSTNLLNYAWHHEDIWEGRDVAPHIVNLSTGLRQVARFMTWSLYPWWKSPL